MTENVRTFSIEFKGDYETRDSAINRLNDGLFELSEVFGYEWLAKLLHEDCVRPKRVCLFNPCFNSLLGGFVFSDSTFILGSHEYEMTLDGSMTIQDFGVYDDEQ